MYVFGTCVLARGMVYIQSVHTLHVLRWKQLYAHTHIQSVCALHISINTHTINVNVINHSHTHTVIESINVDGTRRVKTRKCLLGIYNNWNG